MLSFDEMREIFRRTRILRKPTHGIISGYHELPYVCLGPSCETDFQTTQIRGRVRVSPRFVIRPPHYESHYEDIFGEENVDAELVGRVFGFLGFQDRPVECASKHLEVKHLVAKLDSVLRNVMDEMERNEDITTGVILTPNSRYYPVSIERFIASILEDEFSV